MAQFALVTTVALDWILAQLQAAGTGITHLVIGDSAAAVTGQETALGNELFRTPITDISKIDRSLFVDSYVGSAQAVFMWQEVGLVIGGTAAAGSGILLCRILLTYDHTTQTEGATVSIEIRASATTAT